MPELPKLETEAALRAELDRQRERYAPFLQNLCPPARATRESIALESFDWRVQSEADRGDFRAVLDGRGEWERVNIPHYGGPLGLATTYYRTTFQVTREQLARGAAFICFKGVDYNAHVFLNDTYLGSHEGFFAPFEFDFTACAKVGENTLVVRVENDFICMSNKPWGTPIHGDKIYAATGPGYDDPEQGWHHCPPGMGIYQDVRVEFRPRLFVSDIFVRPLPAEQRAEAWVEVFNCDPEEQQVSLRYSVRGRNFEATVLEEESHTPTIVHDCGVGDDLQIALAKAAGIYRQPMPLRMGRGTNVLKFSFPMRDFRWWTLEEPWLYQFQMKLLDNAGSVVDEAERHFGMRSFRMDEHSEPKGALHFNEKPIRLRGANTMGHEQQCVMRRDWDQLRDDILLAKICHMNFLRLTQRPVQPEVYDYCDMLGLMVQTDFPMFGEFRSTQYCEGLRQVGEMERLVRSHPSVILVSYINEPVNNAGNAPHRNLTRAELEDFFRAADAIVRHRNPDRVIKPCDGDYDPPAPGIQDRHCYTAWYNGQGVEVGKLHKGFWQLTKPDWYYACGEFGAEGLECSELMRKFYPTDWLPGEGEDEAEWTPSRIKDAQTGNFHRFFFDRQSTLEDWIRASQDYQAHAVRMMTEAFRRDNRMNSFAIHLFIDAFPSGWMKTIMDCERRPKRAYFAYREALAPVLPSLRSDRTQVVGGETLELEAWLSNDLPDALDGHELRYEVACGGALVAKGRAPANVGACTSSFQGFIRLDVPHVDDRSMLTARLAVVDAAGTMVNENGLSIMVFPAAAVPELPPVVVVGRSGGPADTLASELGAGRLEDPLDERVAVILIDDFDAFKERDREITLAAQNGARVVFLELPPGTYAVGGQIVEVRHSGFNPLHFASRKTGHPLVEGFEPTDFQHWHDPGLDRISPILETTFACDAFVPVLTSGNTNAEGQWDDALAAGELPLGDGAFLVCQVKLAGRTATNPAARLFATRLLTPMLKVMDREPVSPKTAASA